MNDSNERETCPYVGLQPFEASDRDYFFGRERDQCIIISNLLSSPLTILYGSSGVGKSSLLLAGVVPQLHKERPQTPVVVFRDWGNPGFQQALTRACIDAVWSNNVDQPKPAETLPFDEIVRACGEAAHETMLIILDQFEEYFLYHPKTSTPNSFEAQFARAVNRDNVDAGFLIALREDSLAKLDRFQERIHNLLSNRIRLNHLDAPGATQAIVEPLSVWNGRLTAGQAPMTIEPALVAALLKQVQTGKVQADRHGGSGASIDDDLRIEAPFLQLVMVRLWEEERQQASATLRLTTLESLHGANEIVHNHLDGTMTHLDPLSQAVCARFFDRLVTPSGSKIACSTNDLTTWAGNLAAQVPAVLDTLTDSRNRILRPVAAPDDPESKRYEIFHDVLAPAILDWRRRFVDQENRITAIEQAKEETAKRSLRLWLSITGAMTCIAVAGWLYASLEGQRTEASLKAAEAIALVQTNPSRALDLAIDAASNRIPLGLSPNVSTALGLTPVETVEDALRLAAQAQSRLLEWTLPVSARTVSDVAFSPDGHLFATADRERRVSIWAIGEQAPTKPLLVLPHEEWVRRVIFLPGDSRLLITAAGANAYLWNLDEPARPKRVFANGSKIFSALALSKDGTYVATAGQGKEPRGDSAIKVWAVQGPEENASPIGDFDANGAWVMGLAFSPDGCCLASSAVVTREGSSPATLVIRSVLQGKTLLTLPFNEPSDAVTFTPDGQSLISGSRDNWVRVWKPVEGNLDQLLAKLSRGQPVRDKINWVTHVLAGHTERIRSLDISPDGRYLASASGDWNIKLWNTVTGENLHTLTNHTSYVEAARFSPASTNLASASRDGTVNFWNIGGHNSSITSVAFNQQGNLLATASTDNTVRLWDIAGDIPEQRRVLAGHDKTVFRLSFDPSGRFMATAGFDKRMIVWDTTNGEIIRRFKDHHDELRDVAFSPTGRYVVSTGADGKAWLYTVPNDPMAGTDWPSINITHGSEDSSITSVAFHPNQETWVTAANDNVEQIRLWNFGGQAQGSLSLPDEVRRRGLPSPDIAISPDGLTIACVVRRTVLLWPFSAFTQNQPPRQMQISGENRSTCSNLSFSPDGRYLGVACSDGGVRLLNPQTLALKKTITVHKYGVNDLAFSQDGKRLATASIHNFHISPVDFADLLNVARRLQARRTEEAPSIAPR